MAGTTIDGVCAAGGVGRSQVYHYFDDKNELVRAVIERQAALILGGQEHHPAHIQGWESWEAWRGFVAEIQKRAGRDVRAAAGNSSPQTREHLTSSYAS